MKRRFLITTAALVCAGTMIFAGCGDKNEPEPGPGPGTDPEPSVEVVTGVARVDGTSVTLNGSFTATDAEVTAVGFMYGLSPDMDYGVPAQADSDGNFSLQLTDLGYDALYYYHAYVQAGGEYYNGDIRTFTTEGENSDKIEGKMWIELPAYEVGSAQVAKAYYTTMKDGSYGRNYSILYDEKDLLSVWVAFPMNKNVHLGTISRNEAWQYDTSGDIPTSLQPNVINGTYGTYTTDQLDRGHQIASSDRNGSLSAMHQTYTVTNITPQAANLNQVIWAGLEEAIRSVADQSSIPDQDTLYVVTGPILKQTDPVYVNDRSDKACRVPDGYFKVILWSKYDTATGTRSYDSVGFMFENRHYGGSGWGSRYPEYAFAVSEVETETGWTFFGNTGLSETELAAVKTTSSWSSFTNRNTGPVN